MLKRSATLLRLSRETVRRLTPGLLAQVAGGTSVIPGTCVTCGNQSACVQTCITCVNDATCYTCKGCVYPQGG
jgi:hypothetical protein